MKRETVHLEPSWLLHQRPFRDSSRLVDLYTRGHGRVALVARGARRPKSRLRSVLMPFQPILVSWTRRGELGTLTAAERAGAAPLLAGDTVMSGYYLNELLLRLTESGEAHTTLFANYGGALTELAAAPDPQAALRRFEKRLLDGLGYGLVLRHEAGSNAPVAADEYYDYRAESGPHRAADGGPAAVRGATLLAIAEERFDDPAVVVTARRLLKQALDIYLGGRPLRVRRVARDLRRGVPRAGQEADGSAPGPPLRGES